MPERQRSMMSVGVPAGATMPVNVSLSRSGTPASVLVCTSGNAGERLTLSTASARNFPSLTLDMAGGSAVNAIGVWPPIVELIASAALLNGTVIRSRWYCCLKQFTRQVRRRAGRRLGKAVRTGMSFDQFNELLERLRR